MSGTGFGAGRGVLMAGAVLAGTLTATLAVQPAHAQISDSGAFIKAVRDRDGEKATQIIDGGANVINTRDIVSGESALLIATARRDSNWMRFLLARGANPALADRTGRLPLHAAALVGFVEGVEILLDAGAGVDAINGRGETALIMAVQRRDALLAKLLVTRGADPDKVDRIAGMSARDYARRDDGSGTLLTVLEGAKPRATGGFIGPVIP